MISKIIHFGNSIYNLSSKQFNLDIFQITEKNNKLKTTIFWPTFDMINWHFINCHCKRTPLWQFFGLHCDFCRIQFQKRSHCQIAISCCPSVNSLWWQKSLSFAFGQQAAKLFGGQLLICCLVYRWTKLWSFKFGVPDWIIELHI